MIPKKIHYCWFGGKDIPSQLMEYINNWKVVCPDWEIILWNEDSFDVNSHIFTQTAYKHKKYAYVSDYVRAWALYHFGGVYLDTDVEIKLPLDQFLQYEAFSGFEKVGLPFTAVWGAIPKHSLSKMVLDYYNDRVYSVTEPPNTGFISKYIETNFFIDSSQDINQVGSDGENTINIFSSNYFCLDFPVNYTTHHFSGSWLDNKRNISYKDFLHGEYYLGKLDDLDVNSRIISLTKSISFKQLILINIRYFYEFFRKCIE